jgi:hypothetical protein
VREALPVPQPLPVLLAVPVPPHTLPLTELLPVAVGEALPAAASLAVAVPAAPTPPPPLALPHWETLGVRESTGQAVGVAVAE